jgi:glycosyltransferase involved in cell wall biosynthesis
MSQSKQALFFVNVWPEPLSSAAGLRTRELAVFLQRQGYEVVGIASGPASEYSAQWEKLGVRTFTCDPNQSKTDKTLQPFCPQIVIFDRFYIEEQFGWRARELWPQALQVIDSIDIHCLRRARERALTLQLSWSQLMDPDDELLGDDMLRELASFHRADVTIVVSSFEAEWLAKRGLEAERILWLPFSAVAEKELLPLENRRGFCFLGNFLHAPNMDAVNWLVKELWPAVRQQLPSAELHLYGAYPPPSVFHHKGKSGIFIHGFVEDHRAAIASHQAMLAPLRFGAGIKGKTLEAWSAGTPVVGTPIAFEGMCEGHPEFLSAEEFVREILRLQDSSAWQGDVNFGLKALRETYDPEILFQKWSAYLEQAFAKLPLWRQSLTGRMLRHHGAQSTKYLSRWIEEKNKNVQGKTIALSQEQ